MGEWKGQTEGSERVNSDLLKGKIREKALVQQEVAKRIGVSLSRFNAKLNGTGGAEFNLHEAQAIQQLLDLTEEQAYEIFLKR